MNDPHQRAGTHDGTRVANVAALRCEYLSNPLGIDLLQPRLSWQICSGPDGWKQSAYQIHVATSLEALASDEADLWDSGRVSSEQSIGIRYAGNWLRAGQCAWWRARVWDEDGRETGWSEPAHWSTGPLDESDWIGGWIGPGDTPSLPRKPYLRNGDRKDAARFAREQAPALLMRRESAVTAIPIRAMAYVSGLGYFELYINGQRISDHVLDPGFTDFTRRVYYVTHDVTRELRRGTNVVAAILGNRFFNQPTPDLFQFEKAPWRAAPRLRVDIVLEHADGSRSHISSDASWRWSDAGPIRFNCIRGGETIDARSDPGAWMQPGFDDSQWSQVAQVRPPAGTLAAQMIPPMRITGSFQPVEIREPQAGVWLADFGRNLTGWVRMETNGEAGQVITLEHNEVLKDDGTLDTRHSAGHTYGRFQQARYITSGRDGDVFEPRFTYHGFRYVQITGLQERPAAESLAAKLVHTDLRDAGHFECSNRRLNQLHAAVRRTLLDCVHGMPAEEPTREKMGWTQDGQNNMESYVYNFESHALYRKYVQDMIDAQEPNGHIPPIIPTNGWGYQGPKGPEEFICDDPWWGGTLAVCVDHLHTYYGDLDVVDSAFESTRRYVDWIGTTTSDRIVTFQLGDWLDADWSGYRPGLTPVPVTSTAGYFHLTSLLVNHARILGRDDQARHYAQLAHQISASFNNRFLDREGWYARGSQTAQALALHVGIVPPDRVEQVRANLIADIHGRGRRISAGFLGAMPVMYELSDGGHAELAYELATAEKDDGWLYMVEGDNSTLGENLHPKGYGSRHHPFAACIGAWFYSRLAGIRPDPAGPGFKKTIIKPAIIPQLDWVRAHHDSPYGRISSHWQRCGSKVVLKATIPANTTATIILPGQPAIQAAPGQYELAVHE